MPYEDELSFAISLVRSASEVVLKHYEKVAEIRWKGKNDPVTDADEAVTAYVVSSLQKDFPHDGILIEERADDGSRFSKKRTWIVDPLDGTQEFIDKNGEFTVMVGLVDGGKPVMGVVAIPVEGKIHAGVVNGPVFFEDRNKNRTEIKTPDSCPVGEARLIVSRSHRSSLIDVVKERLGITKELRCGSVGLKMVKVISGDADLYVHFGGKMKLWDTCAPEAIARAAGVMFTDLRGKEIDYLSADVELKHGVIVTGKSLYPEVLVKIGDLVRQ